MGSNPIRALIFFRPYFHYYLSSVHYRQDRFHIRLFNLSSHIDFHLFTVIYSAGQGFTVK